MSVGANRRLALPALLILFSGSVVAWSKAASEPPGVIVDCAVYRGEIRHYALGFNSNSAPYGDPSGPSDSLLAPLNPSIVRGDWGMLRKQKVFQRWRMVSHKVKRLPIYHLGLGLNWDDTVRSPMETPEGATKWKGIITTWLGGEIARFAEELHDDIVAGRLPTPQAGPDGVIELGEILQLDLWNEPDGYFTRIRHAPNGAFFVWPTNPYFEDFYSAWKYSIRVIRDYYATYPLKWPKWEGKTFSFQPRIIGPSYSGFHHGFLKQFYERAKSDTVLPDILNWHALSVYSIRSTEDDIRAIRTMIGDDPVRISINEWGPCDGCTGPDLLLQANPAVSLRYFAILERHQVFGARSCHSEPGGIGSCESATLNGLLTPGKRKRAVWHTFAAFSRCRGRTLGLDSLPAGVEAIAFYDSSRQEGSVLAGRYDHATVGSIQVVLKNLPSEIFRKGRVRLEATLIENRSFSEYPEPKVLRSPFRQAVSKGTLTFRVGPLRFGDVVHLKFSSP